MNKLKKIFQSTIAKIISFLLIILFALSMFFFFDAYKRVYRAAKGYWEIYKGDKAFKNKELSKAIYFYEKGIRLHPRHYRAMYNLANIYVVYEDYYSAIENYKKALDVRPDYEIARIDYAIVLSEIYQIDEAIKQYEKIISDNPKLIKIPFVLDGKKSHKHNKGVAYYNMGLAYRTKSMLAGVNNELKNKYLKDAENSYIEAVDILKSYNSNYNLGLVYQLLRNYHKAGYYYCKAIETEPMEYEAHFNLAVILNNMKDYIGANKEFQKANLILSAKGNSEKSQYVFYMLMDVGQKIALLNNDDKLYKHLDEKKASKEPKYKAGKLVLEEDKNNNEIIEDFKVCEGKEKFGG